MSFSPYVLIVLVLRDIEKVDHVKADYHDSLETCIQLIKCCSVLYSSFTADREWEVRRDSVYRHFTWDRVKRVGEDEIEDRLNIGKRKKPKCLRDQTLKSTSVFKFLFYFLVCTFSLQIFFTVKAHAHSPVDMCSFMLLGISSCHFIPSDFFIWYPFSVLHSFRFPIPQTIVAVVDVVVSFV